MHRKFIIYILVIFTVPVFAQKGIVIEANSGIGYSNIDYLTSINYNHKGGMQTTYNFGFSYNMTDHFGLGIGISYSSYCASININDYLTWDNIVDSEGEIYQHILNLKGWNESQKLSYFEIPLSLQFNLPIFKKNYLFFNLGVGYGIILNASYEASGILEHLGYYDRWGLTLENLSSHGFYRTSNFKPSGSFGSKNMFFTCLDIGIIFPISTQWEWYSSTYLRYNLSNNLIEDRNDELGFRDDAINMNKKHYFMTNYGGIINTSYIDSKNAGVYSYGIKLGLRYLIPPTKRTKCHCIKSYRASKRIKKLVHQ